MKITYDSFTAEEAWEAFARKKPCFVATASYTSKGCLYEIHGNPKTTKPLALKDLKQACQSEGVELMHKLLGSKNPHALDKVPS